MENAGDEASETTLVQTSGQIAIFVAPVCSLYSRARARPEIRFQGEQEQPVENFSTAITTSAMRSAARI